MRNERTAAMRIERIRAVTVETGADVMVRSNYVFAVLETDACDAEAEVEARCRGDSRCRFRVEFV